MINEAINIYIYYHNNYDVSIITVIGKKKHTLKEIPK